MLSFSSEPSLIHKIWANKIIPNVVENTLGNYTIERPLQLMRPISICDCFMPQVVQQPLRAVLGHNG